MKRIILRAITIVFVMIGLTGCVVKQSVPLDYEPSESQKNLDKTYPKVIVNVEDKRSYVVNSEKEPNYIGKYRATYYNPWAVTTKSKEALSMIIKRDLLQELQHLGFIELDSSDKTLLVDIVYFIFDTYMNADFKYQVDVKVVDNNKNVLAKKSFKKKVKWNGGFMGPKYVVEEKLPIVYNELIVKILEDKNILEALKGDSNTSLKNLHTSPSTNNILGEKILNLKKLYKDGLITEDEYINKKKQLLDNY